MKAARAAAAGDGLRQPSIVAFRPRPNQPSTFCAPWAKKMTPSPNRTTRCD